MNIDFSKAPEGATHWHEDSEVWCMVVGKTVFYWKRGCWIKSFIIFTEDDYIARPTAPTWNGEGLPPVGSTVEALAREHGDEQEWEEVKVIAHDEGVPIVKWDYKYFSRDLSTLRPIRTPEQIAAEERDRVVRGILERGLKNGAGVATMLKKAYDAGAGKMEN